MKRKDGHHSKPFGKQGRELKRPYLLLNDKTRRHDDDFPGHCSKAQNSASEHFGAPRKQGTFWDEQEYE